MTGKRDRHEDDGPLYCTLIIAAIWQTGMALICYPSHAWVGVALFGTVAILCLALTAAVAAKWWP